MSITIAIRDAVKRYENHTVIPSLSLEIQEGEFFTLLGPSGCGKTTLLRMIAGFNTIEGGDFFFNEKRINDLDPSKRSIGMVFQNYAIFPHLSVEKNVAFGLRNNKELSNSEKKARTDQYLQLMQIASFRHRMPDKLSGGQQQRVALARALAIEPDVLLMDEPLSNLDAKLRVEMRLAIKEIQKKMGITTVYVTHDQEEAMAVSDRIAVMNLGEIQQIGSPEELYHRPANLFVATFIGHTNILEGTLAVEGSEARLHLGNYQVPIEGIANGTESGAVKVSIRPEEFILSAQETEGAMQGIVENSIFLGLNTHYYIRLESGERVEAVMESMLGRRMANGSQLHIQIKTEKVNVLAADGSRNLLIKGGV